jgi:hypothetical protein
MHVARIDRARTKKIARMIEQHQDHDQATKQINAVDPRSNGDRARRAVIYPLKHTNRLIQFDN